MDPLPLTVLQESESGNIFIQEVRSSGIRVSITVVNVRKVDEMY